MEDSRRAPYGGFIGTKPAQILGIALALATVTGMLAAGVYRNFCLFAFVGIVLFVIPKILGVKDVKVMTVMGVVFILLSTLLGAFAFSIPAIEDNGESNMDGDFNTLVITEQADGTYTVTVTYTGTQTGDVKMYVPRIGTTSFKVISTGTVDPVDMTGSGTVYTYGGLELKSGELRAIYFEMVSGEDVVDSSNTVFITENVTHSDVVKHALTWNLYVAGLAALVFFLVLILTSWMRHSLEKTRARMEAEGRLYPQGYGRCKGCGMIVLPGETVCRKCGAYIDIPEEIKAKMKRKVEYSVCSECGAEVPMDARRCPKCGASFDEETEEVVIEASEEEIAERIEKQEESDDSFECSECGAKVPADADVCPQCGARFDEDEE